MSNFNTTTEKTLEYPQSTDMGNLFTEVHDFLAPRVLQVVDETDF